VLTLRQLLLPYGPTFLGGLLLAYFGEGAVAFGTLGLLFGLFAIAAAVLAIRFRCLRPLLATLCLLAVFSFESWLGRNSSYSLSLAVAALNLLFLISVEDALDWEIAGWWSGLMAFEVVVLYGATRYFNQEWQALNLYVAGPVNAAVLLGFLATTGLLMKFLLKSDAINAGLLWTAVCLAVALLHGGRFQVSCALLTGMACIGSSLIERSYWIAYHDELTGIPGRRAFNETIAALTGTYSIAIVDIDHFKSFNDTYGHETGDQVLRKVAAKLRTVGGGGKVFRCGGEEFAIVFSLAIAEAAQHADAVRIAVEKDTFMVRGPARSKRERTERRLPERAPRRGSSVSSHVTVSIGVCQGTSAHETQAVIAKADKALYKAKESGRNRVIAVPARGAASKPLRARSATDLA
jgi:diguanylate cyclase (GGDEF)-like protein